MIKVFGTAQYVKFSLFSIYCLTNVTTWRKGGGSSYFVILWAFLSVTGQGPTARQIYLVEFHAKRQVDATGLEEIKMVSSELGVYAFYYRKNI